MKRYKTYTPSELTVWIRELIAKDDIHAFYISKAWLHLRAEVLGEHKGDGCEICKKKGLYVPATTVHHIKTVREYPWLALTKANLMAICEECHYQIHHSNKPKWDDERFE